MEIFKRKKVRLVITAIIILLIVGLGNNILVGKDDWQYAPEMKWATYIGILSNKMKNSMSTTSNEMMGFSVGGAKDINNFRQNIEDNFLPASTDITYEGLYYDYYFDTGKNRESDKMFYPSYSYAVSKDPLSKKDEYYLQVGLNSNIKESDFKRKKLNLLVVLDISGSMGSPFDEYYYDRFKDSQASGKEEKDDKHKTKMQIANEAVVGLLGRLNSDDRFGMVLFDNEAYLAKPIRKVGETNMNAIKNNILEITERGGTNMEAGIKKGTELYKEYLNANQDEYENRMIFITDAMPNIYDTSEEGLMGMTKINAANKIYTTFIGVGVDFNTQLIDSITKVRGANYYSVHSEKEFKTRMDNEFEYMVTPLVFDLNLNLTASGFKIEKVYGSPEANEATGEIMKVNTLFPSKTENGETKGGIVILKLNKIGDNQTLKLSTTFVDRTGKKDGESVEIKLPLEGSEYYDNTGIRKGILLARYVNIIKNWINNENRNKEQDKPVIPVMNYDTGIMCPRDEEIPELGQWERQSSALKVSSEYNKMITDFKNYFELEARLIGDNTLDREVKLMEKILGH